MNRRRFVGGMMGMLPLSAVSGPIAALGAAGPRRSPQGPGPAGGGQGGAVAIASANGLEAVARAYQELAAGADPVDAAIAGVNLVELDPDDLTVGYGGLPNFEGVVQLDSAVMHGPSGKGGAVAALEGVKTPSKVAKLVMDRTDHVLLVGEGARRFATMHGFPVEELLTERSRKIWLYWRENLSDKDDWEEPALDRLDPEVREFIEESGDLFRDRRPTGTIHLSALTPSGDLGCCTTTSGLFFKVPGRVGDSPLIGAGLYCDNDVGSAGGTGRGEAAILSCAGHTVVEHMRQGRDPEAACLATLERVAHLTRDPLLKRPDGRPAFNLRLYAVAKSGAYGSAAIWSSGRFAVADARGARLEDQAFLYEQ
ncbi:MAG TPA: N(4)-(beta-N-acetylglucosaminyl)-L-asparaginase [Thermoanaerobaculia bacterium]|nr:N(4)-(beta-N-acetylglucosaminyl)-L-asparaginase [Thermoanaerobaculia bacterium]